MIRFVSCIRKPQDGYRLERLSPRREVPEGEDARLPPQLLRIPELARCQTTAEEPAAQKPHLGYPAQLLHDKVAQPAVRPSPARLPCFHFCIAQNVLDGGGYSAIHAVGVEVWPLTLSETTFRAKCFGPDRRCESRNRLLKVWIPFS